MADERADLVAWSPEVVEALNRYQREGFMHPFTCGNDRGDAAHVAAREERGDPDLGLLIATPEGWRCPACDYRQNWYHAFMLEAPREPFAILKAKGEE